MAIFLKLLQLLFVLPTRFLGRGFIHFLSYIGSFFIFIGLALWHCISPPFYGRLVLAQFMTVGYFSLPVVSMMAFFTGSVLALQVYYGGGNYNTLAVIASIVELGITRELAPVLAGLMVAGRMGSAMAAELGTMRVSEQIDALVTLQAHPYKYLVSPRFIAAVISLPCLVVVADIVGIFGGMVAATHAMGASWPAYIQETMNFFKLSDLTSGMIKAAVFGFIIALMGCYHGFNSKEGALGVGNATTYAVSMSSVLILASNYLMTALIFS